MIDKVRQYIKSNQMVKKGDKVVLGVSGGADSMCLLYIFLKLLKEFQLKLYVVHVNHMLRGNEADKDEQYVVDTCKRFNLPCHVIKRDMEAYAKRRHLSPEEAGREIRYQAFEEIKQKYQCDVIAVAHNSNDCAETMIFQLARGSGLTGLSSIPCKRGDIIRPLLTCTRREIEQYLEAYKIAYRTDATNLLEDYTRNKIRLQVLPYLEENINKNSIAHIANASFMLREVTEYMDRQIEYILDRDVIKAEGIYQINRNTFLSMDVVIQKALVRRIIESVSGRLKDITSTHIEEVCKLVKKHVGKRLDLPYEMLAYVDYTSLVIGLSNKIEQTNQEGQSKEYPIWVEEGYERELLERKQAYADTYHDELELGNEYRIQFQCLDIKEEQMNKKEFVEAYIRKRQQDKEDNSKNSMINEQNYYTKCFDYDKIKNTVQVRTRREGDYFQVDKAGGNKKLKSFFVDAKIPRQSRNHIPLLADGSHIMWIIGSRMSEAYKVSKSTNKILIVNIFGGNQDGR